MWFNMGQLTFMLKTYNETTLIGEILIINNRKGYDYKELLERYSKIRILNDGNNLFVNPSWNLGVKEAKFKKIIIANDDITISNFKLVVMLVDIHLRDKLIIGFHKSAFSNTKNEDIKMIKPDKDCDTYGFGVFMAMKKDDYVELPEEMKVWYGDTILFKANTPYLIQGVQVETHMRGTSSRLNLKQYRISDRVYYSKYMKGIENE